MKKTIDFLASKITYLLICFIIISCNTFADISGRYVSKRKSLFFHKELTLHPDSTYNAYCWIYGLEEICDSGIWIATNNNDSIELKSTLPDFMNIPIDMIEEQTDSERITIIFDRPYKGNGAHRNLLDWKLTIDEKEFILNKDTLLLNMKYINTMVLEASEVANIYKNYFTNHKVKTKTYTVKNKNSNKFTIVLPPYVCEGVDIRTVNIFHASPINKTIHRKKLKKIEIE